MSFINRFDAGKKLSAALEKYRNDKNAIVLALPRGGVQTGYEAAKELNLPLDITCPRKIGAPSNEEFAIGAITETGEGILHQDVIDYLRVSDAYLKAVIEEEKAVAEKRLQLYRKGRPPRQLKGKTVLIVDDGLATGATMQAAIASVKKEGAAKIVLAVPVSPPDTLPKFTNLADEIVCLMTPRSFYAVGQFYADFAPVSDQEVVTLLHNYWDSVKR
jgi:putative phosphoribosyl transferase